MTARDARALEMSRAIDAAVSIEGDGALLPQTYRLSAGVSIPDGSAPPCPGRRCRISAPIATRICDAVALRQSVEWPIIHLDYQPNEASDTYSVAHVDLVGGLLSTGVSPCCCSQSRPAPMKYYASKRRIDETRCKGLCLGGLYLPFGKDEGEESR